MVTPIIPDDIIATEILPRSSAKSLLRFRSVCKTWNKLISDTVFINLQMNRSVERNAMHITLVFNTSPLTIYSLDPENPTVTVPDNINAYPPPFTSFYNDIGYCGGFVCTRFNYGSQTLSVWNTSTRTHMTIPYYGLPRQSSYGFIYDVTSYGYKFVSISYVESSDSSEVTVYSIGDGEGKFMGNIPYQTIPKKAGVVANGAVHWLAFSCMPDQRSKQVIIAFSPTCQKFEEIQIPAIKSDYLDDLNLAQLGGSLTVVFAYIKIIEVWLMKEYGMKESWSIYFLVPTDEVYYLNRPLRVAPLYITKKGDLILQINYKKLFIYDQKQRSLRSIRIKYPETDLHLMENTSNLPFYAITLLDSLMNVRNSHGGQQFLGTKNKPELCLQGTTRTLTHCYGNRTTESMVSDSANDSTDAGVYYRQTINKRFSEIVINTANSKLYKVLKECKMDLEAAALKFAHQVIFLVLREIDPYMKREFGASPQQILADAIAKNPVTKNKELDFASTRQIPIENDSNASYGFHYAEKIARELLARISFTPERLNHDIPYANQQNSQGNNKFYQINQNQQSPSRNSGVYARIARLVILMAASKYNSYWEPELEARKHQASIEINAARLRKKNKGADSASVSQSRGDNHSNVCYDSIEGNFGGSHSDFAIKLSVRGNDDANTSSSVTQNQQLPEGRQYTRPSLTHSADHMGMGHPNPNPAHTTQEGAQGTQITNENNIPEPRLLQ